jgi:hypothetical protein
VSVVLNWPPWHWWQLFRTVPYGYSSVWDYSSSSSLRSRNQGGVYRERMTTFEVAGHSRMFNCLEIWLT